jgi:hypothetical protein
MERPMTDFLPIESKIPTSYRRDWISAAFNDTLPPSEYKGTFAPRKIDILLRADELTGKVDDALLDRVAAHPRLGTLIIYGASEAEQVAIMAREVMLGIQVRFCESTEELRILLGKRRSCAIVDSTQLFRHS